MFQFICLLQKLLVTCICLLLAAEVACCKNLLVTCCKICLLLIAEAASCKKLVITRCRSCLLQKVTR